MLAVLSIIAAIGIGYGVVSNVADAGTCEKCDPVVAKEMLAQMQYVDQNDYNQLVACSNKK